MNEGEAPLDRVGVPGEDGSAPVGTGGSGAGCSAPAPANALCVEPSAPASAPRADAGAALLALATGGWRQAALAVAGRLDLVAMLGARSADLEEVCYSLGTARQPTQLFLAACEGLGLVQERDGEYRLGPAGHALRAAPAGAVLTDWAAAASDTRVGDALWEALHLPRLGDAPPADRAAPGRAAVAALGLPFGDAPPADAARARATLQALHGPAAAALAAALPLPPAGLVLESGGLGLYAAAVLRRGEHLRTAIVDAAPWAAAEIAGGATSDAGRVRVLAAPAAWGGVPAASPARDDGRAALDALDDERAALAVVAQTTRTLSPSGLGTRLAQLAGCLAPGATVATVGPFRGGAGRALAPLLALLDLAAGGPGWCPTIEQVADAVQAAGFTISRTLLLPEPAVALLARRA